MQVDEELIHRQSQLVGCIFDDTQVGLMRDNQVEVSRSHTGVSGDIRQAGDQLTGGELKYFLPVHADVHLALINHIL